MTPSSNCYFLSRLPQINCGRTGHWTGHWTSIKKGIIMSFFDNKKLSSVVTGTDFQCELFGYFPSYLGCNDSLR